MTWKTSSGERVLLPKEANLFCSCIATAIDFADDGESGLLNYGDPLIQAPFEQLGKNEKYAVLEDVTRALLLETPSCPKLTAINESAIYYVYRWLAEQFDDVDSGEEVWGAQVIAALQESGAFEEMEGEEGDEDGGYLPKMGCLDRDRWENGCEALADRILWDRDFEMADLLGHGTKQGIMAFATMDSDYFQPYAGGGGGAARGAKDRLYRLVRRVADAA
ncbi:hypothetical protein HYH02_005373 [Chlamydomonas schloesseri]|uniref:Uncharacterized protein n=1 Tax=Chlamydomonas schloesseri TaxID=2026947 RepID=A0A835WNE1_9CHLO|nr:hypothetical protein HYH02_005373 [Chlamydomonas schloesseri]|eukprot:KAG2449850.1 hypothetical protein HYH02_005373 [Chlamydomonas schloesseri]